MDTATQGGTVAPPADDTGTQYLSAQVQVALEVQEYLLSTWPMLQPIAAIVQRTSGSRDQVFRACRNLAARRHAEEHPGGWTAGPALTTLAERMRVRLVELATRYLPGETR